MTGARPFHLFDVRLQRRVPREVPQEFVRVGEAQALGQVTDQQDPEDGRDRPLLAAVARLMFQKSAHLPWYSHVALQKGSGTTMISMSTVRARHFRCGCPTAARAAAGALDLLRRRARLRRAGPPV